MRPAGLLPPERAELAARTPIANVGDTRGVDGALCPVVVGRGAELATLVDHLDAAAGGRGRLVTLVGETGTGCLRWQGL